MATIIVSLDLQFRDAEHLRSEYHGFANLMNVVHAELQLLERMSGPEAGLRPNIRLCEAATRSFKDAETASEHGPALSEFKSRVHADLARVQATPAYEQDAEEARDIIRQVIDDADLRIQETLARYGIRRRAGIHDRETIRAMILAGAGGALQHTCATDKLRIDANGKAQMPHGLAEAVGRLGAELLNIDGCVAIDVSPATGTVPDTVIAVRTEPLELDIIPTNPPSSLGSSTPGGTVRALIALISYIAGPGAEVTVDPGGKPLLLVRCLNA